MNRYHYYYHYNMMFIILLLLSSFSISNAIDIDIHKHTIRNRLHIHKKSQLYHRSSSSSSSSSRTNNERTNNVLEPASSEEMEKMMSSSGMIQTKSDHYNNNGINIEDKDDHQQTLKEIEDKRQFKFKTAKEVIVQSQLTNDLLALETKTLCDEEYINTMDIITASDPWGMMAEDLYDEKVARNVYVETLAESLRVKNIQVAYLSKAIEVLSRQRYRLYKKFTRNILSQINIYQAQFALQGTLYEMKSFKLTPDELKSLLKTSYTEEMNNLDKLYRQATDVSTLTYTHTHTHTIILSL